MSRKRILFVDDDASGRKIARFNLEEASFDVVEAESGEAALKVFEERPFDAVITDIRMPGMSGMDLLESLRSLSSDIPVLVITAFATINVAVEAIKLGAADFIVKPFNKDQLVLAVKKAIDNRELRKENRRLRLQVRGVERPIICASYEMKEILSLVDRVAASDAPVLISGESGTGKEVIARRIHAASKRSEGPFVAINCAAIPGELLESELFGHTEGAFTGARKGRLGRFRQANGGTLFLDEIGEIPGELQSKLLRVLQERVVDVVGEDKPREVDIRLVSATNCDLEERVMRGQFRDDLFYRLNVVGMTIPPLRDRREDIEVLARHFVELFSEGREIAIPDEVLSLLKEYDWPGNVRELENACQRLVLLSDGEELSLRDLPDAIARSCGSGGSDGGGAVTTLNSISGMTFELPEAGFSLLDLEKDIIVEVLRAKNWNVSQSASYLGIPRHVLAYRMEKYGIYRK